MLGSCASQALVFCDLYIILIILGFWLTWFRQTRLMMILWICTTELIFCWSSISFLKLTLPQIGINSIIFFNSLQDCMEEKFGTWQFHVQWFVSPNVEQFFHSSSLSSSCWNLSGKLFLNKIWWSFLSYIYLTMQMIINTNFINNLLNSLSNLEKIFGLSLWSRTWAWVRTEEV